MKINNLLYIIHKLVKVVYELSTYEAIHQKKKK